MHRLANRLFLAMAPGIAAVSGLLAGCGGETPADAAVVPDARPQVGTLSVAWQLTDGMGALTCQDVAALTVTLTATPVAGGFGEIDTFGCEAGTATTRAIAAGLYNVELRLRAPSGALAESFRMNGVEVTTDQDTDLGAVTFEVPPRGNLELTVDTRANSENCAPLGEAGGGLTGVQIELQDREGACVPLTLEIGEGASLPASTYATCMGQVHGCIENDQVIRATGMASGPHRLIITGGREDGDCYRRMTQFDVPGNDLTVALSAQTLERVPMEECGAARLRPAPAPLRPAQ